MYSISQVSSCPNKLNACNTNSGIGLQITFYQYAHIQRGHSYMTSWLPKGGGGSPKGDTST